MAVAFSPPIPPLSAISSRIAEQPGTDNFHAPHYTNLALQVLHNLQHEHGWTTFHIHSHSPINSIALPRPLISGLPPHRIYVHPDDQIEELKQGLEDGEGRVEREWVLPTHLNEKWSLRRFSDVFDAIDEEPLGRGGSDVSTASRITSRSSKKRRGGKRILLATMGNDSTVVYYIVHDGIVKPRQN
ncbi:hypothetical protein MMC21_002235 [Puttea exsequens]|nr:hypothetical protein [Puttea exsequens]